MNEERRRIGVAPRAGALVLDLIVAGIPLVVFVGIVAGQTYSGPGQKGVYVHGWGVVVWAALLLAYFVVLEAVSGATIGKRIVRIRVTTDDGNPIGWTASLVRNVVRVVDAFPYVVPYLVGAIAIALDGEDKRRVGDHLAGTVVVASD